MDKTERKILTSWKNNKKIFLVCFWITWKAAFQFPENNSTWYDFKIVSFFADFEKNQNLAILLLTLRIFLGFD